LCARPLFVEALECAQNLFPWPVRGLDFDNDSVFMNDTVVSWCRSHGTETTRSRACKKSDQAFVEQKNGAIVRRPVGYGQFESIDATRLPARLFAAARQYVNLIAARAAISVASSPDQTLTPRWSPSVAS
jgi:hypothetical protein